MRLRSLPVVASLLVVLLPATVAANPIPLLTTTVDLVPQILRLS